MTRTRQRYILDIMKNDTRNPVGVQSTVAKWGASLAVRIPKAIAEQWGVSEGSRIELIPRGEQVVIRKKRYDLAEMLEKVTPGNLHSEVDMGPPAGREEW